MRKKSERTENLPRISFLPLKAAPNLDCIGEAYARRSKGERLGVLKDWFEIGWNTLAGSDATREGPDVIPPRSPGCPAAAGPAEGRSTKIWGFPTTEAVHPCTG
jgi:hypothetical protein